MCLPVYPLKFRPFRACVIYSPYRGTSPLADLLRPFGTKPSCSCPERAIYTAMGEAHRLNKNVLKGL